MIKFIFILFLPLCVYSQGSLVVSNGINIISTNNQIINLYNTNLYNNSSSNLGIGTIWGFTGNLPQTIYGTYINSFYGLRLNNSNGFNLQSNTTISNRLDMVSGDINLSGYNLEIGTSTTNTGEINWTNGTINGPLKRWFSPNTNLTQSSGIFPIGNNSINRNVTINYTQAPTDGGYITVEYKNGEPTMVDNYNGLPLWSSDGQLIQNYENDGYFEITPFDYNSSLNTKEYNLKIKGNSLTTINDITGVRLLKSPGPNHNTWVTCGTHSSINVNSSSDFTITSTNVVGFSWFNFGGGNENPLPIELLSFAGKCENDEVTLNWKTASEFNSSYFILEKSTDGQNWRELNNQPAAGNSTEELNYTFVDKNINNYYNYYRLTQIDENGESKTFNTILVDCDSNSELFKTLPNSSSNSFQVLIKNKSLIGVANINIVDTKGMLVSNINIEVIDGINLFFVNENLASGIYYIKINNKSYSTKVIKHIIH